MDWLCQYHPDHVLDHTSTFIRSDKCDNTLQADNTDVNLSSQMDSGSNHVSQIGKDSDHTSVKDALSSIPIASLVAITSESNDALSVGHHSEVLSALQQEENMHMPNNERDESIA